MHYVALLLIQVLSGIALLGITGLLLFSATHRKKYKFIWNERRYFLIGALVACLLLLFAGRAVNTVVSFDYFMRTAGPAIGPQLPLLNAFHFLWAVGSLRTVDNIAAPATLSPTNLGTEHEKTFWLQTEEVMTDIAHGVTENVWTFNGTVPGPFLRVRQGDHVTITVHNNINSLHTHSIDLHGVTGPGGGATVTQVPPGEERSFSFTALQTGAYVYHCATPNVGVHMTHGMYGLLIVEPPEGLAPVDKEFYIMQGEYYTKGAIGTQGLQIFDVKRYLTGDPTYVVFNGKKEGAVGTMHATVGDRVRMFVGNGGVNLASNFHVIGEIFDTVNPEGGTPTHHNIQTTTIPAGSATIVEFTVDLPGKYILVDHALARLDKGAWGILEVTGQWNDTIYSPEPGPGMMTKH